MRRMRLASLALSFAVAAALGACATGGGKSMFGNAPAGVDTRVVLLEVTDEHTATMFVGSAPINLLQRRSDVYDIKRAGDRNQIYVLVDATTSPEMLAEAIGLGYRARVVKVISPESDAPATR